MTTKYDDDDDGDDDGGGHGDELETDAITMEMEPQSKRFRPRVQKTWSTDHIYKLICFVKSENCIWNAASNNYNNKLARKDAWSRICSNFDGLYDVSELHAKWTNLRIQYRNTTTKSNKSRSVWKFANVLAFLRQGNALTEDPATKITNHISHPCNSSVEDSNDSSLNVASASGKEEPVSTASSHSVISGAHCLTYHRHSRAEPSPASITSASLLERDRETMHDRDAALVQYLLSELRSLSESEANVLRCRLQRTLLEFNEERQNSLNLNTINQMEHGLIDIKYSTIDN